MNLTTQCQTTIYEMTNLPNRNSISFCNILDENIIENQNTLHTRFNRIHYFYYDGFGSCLVMMVAADAITLVAVQFSIIFSDESEDSLKMWKKKFAEETNLTGISVPYPISPSSIIVYVMVIKPHYVTNNEYVSCIHCYVIFLSIFFYFLALLSLSLFINMYYTTNQIILFKSIFYLSLPLVLLFY